MSDDGKKAFRDLSSDICPPSSDGGVAQLGERLLCKQEVIGSIPFTSTSAPAARGGRMTDDGGRIGVRLRNCRRLWPSV
jgi:hypothetical protein